ncbi:hypothetical protein AABB24_014733, partial [Solanum stoloniferum]
NFQPNTTFQSAIQYTKYNNYQPTQPTLNSKKPDPTPVHLLRDRNQEIPETNDPTTLKPIQSSCESRPSAQKINSKRAFLSLALLIVRMKKVGESLGVKILHLHRHCSSN